MVSLNPISAKKLIKLLTNLGFVEVRRKGSHCFFFNSSKGLTTVIPDHANEDLGIGLLRKILRDINLGVDEFEKLR